MASGTVPIGGVAAFEEDDTKPDEEREEDVSSGTEESQRTDSDQGFETQVRSGTSDNNSDQGLEPLVPSGTSDNNSDQGLEPLEAPSDTSDIASDQDLEPLEVPNDNFSIVTEENIPLSCSIAPELSPALANSASPINTSRNDEMDLLPVPSSTCFNIGPEQVTEDSLDNVEAVPIQPTANESYMASMLRQESRHQNYQNQNIVHMEHHMHAAKTCLIDKEQPMDEARSTEVTEVLPNSRTRPPETRPQGVPHGGGIGIPLINTCNMDQFLNGLHQIFRFPLFLQLLEELAGRFPDSYRHLWEAVLLCKKGRFAEAKFRLVPYVYDMLSSEGQRVMPLIERQLCHRSDTLCEGCHTSSLGLPVYNIPLGNFDPSTGFQEAFRSYFIQHGVCRREGCNGQTTSNAVFESGTPPLILAVNLISLRHRIPNSQVVNDREIVELFGERYMMFLFTFVRPGNEDLHILGHYMSRAFIPEGRTDSEGRPTGRWYYYPNNQEGDLEPWTTDPPGTFPSYAFFIRLPAPSEAAPCTVQEEEETPHSEDNEDDG